MNALRSMLEFCEHKFMTAIGDIYFEGFFKPFWFTYNPRPMHLNGDELYDVIELVMKNKLMPGDILLSRCDKYIDSWLIPGCMTHAGMYVGKNRLGRHTAVHAIAEGVVEENVIDFFHTDYLVILRPTMLCIKDRAKAAEKAYSLLGTPYDFSFRFTDHFCLCCTELVGYSYEQFKNIFKFSMKPRFGRGKTLIADDIMLTPNLQVVYMNQMVKRLPVWGERMKLQEEGKI